MDIKTEIYLNQLAQAIKPLNEGMEWFANLTESEQLDVLQTLDLYILQAGGLSSDADEAIRLSGLRPTFTPCQLLLKSAREEPRGNRLLKQILAKIVNLPAQERLKSFPLLMNLFGVADARRRARELEPERHWWHQDLSDEGVLLRIMNERAKRVDRRKLRIDGDGWVVRSWHTLEQNADIFLDWQGETYSATLFTLDNVKHLMKSWAESEYSIPIFWSVNAIIVEEINVSTITTLISKLIERDEIASAFARCGDSDEIVVSDANGEWRLPIEHCVVGRCVIDHAFALEFHRGAEIMVVRIEGDFVISESGHEHRLMPSEPAGLGPAIGLFGQMVSSARVLADGSLELDFEDGRILTVLPDPNYEAWEFYGSNGLRIVCGPGGSVSVWQPKPAPRG